MSSNRPTFSQFRPKALLDWNLFHQVLLPIISARLEACFLLLVFHWPFVTSQSSADLTTSSLNLQVAFSFKFSIFQHHLIDLQAFASIIPFISQQKPNFLFPSIQLLTMPFSLLQIIADKPVQVLSSSNHRLIFNLLSFMLCFLLQHRQPQLLLPQRNPLSFNHLFRFRPHYILQRLDC